MKTIVTIFLSIVCGITLFSCEKGTKSTPSVKQKFFVRAKIYPPLQVGQSSIPGSSNYFEIYLPPSGEVSWYGVNSTQSLAEFSSKAIELNNGESCMVTVLIRNQFDLKCRTVTLEGVQNGKVIQTYTLNMGASPSGRECTDGGTQQRRFELQ